MTGTLNATLRAGRWQHVASLSSAAFAVRNFGILTVRGTIPIVEAWVDVDAAGDPAAAHAALDLAAINTANAKRDKDLRKPGLLDTARCPVLAFSGGRPQRAGRDWQLAGTLQGRAAADVVLDAAIVESERDGELTVTATTTFDRRDLGVRAPRFLIGRTIVVTIGATFRMPA